MLTPALLLPLFAMPVIDAVFLSLCPAFALMLPLLIITLFSRLP